MRIGWMLVLLCAAAFGAAQTVTPMDRPMSAFRRVQREAIKQNCSWPILADGETGTYLVFTSDFRNADVTVVSSAPKDEMLAKLKEVAKAVGLPKTDFLVRQGTITSTVDMEFNDAMIRTEKVGSFTFPLRMLIQEMEARKVPGPMVVALRNNVEAAVLQNGAATRTLTEDWTILSKDEALKWESFSVRETLAPWAPLAGWLVLAMVAGLAASLYCMILWLVVMAIRALKLPPTLPEQAPDMSPAEVQADYDAKASVPKWKKVLSNAPAMLPLLLIVPLMVMGNLDNVLNQALNGLPLLRSLFSNAQHWMMPAFVPLTAGLVAIPILKGMKSRRDVKAGRKENDQAAAEKEGWPRWILVMMPLCALVPMSAIMYPDLLRVLPADMARPIIITVLVLPLAQLAFFLIRSLIRAKSKDAAAAGFVLEETKRLAKQTGAKIKRVVVRESNAANAWASLFGTVGVTTRTRDELSNEELTAVLAHEVGHVKALDVPRLFLISLTIAVAAGGVFYWLSHMDNSLGRTLSVFAPIFYIFLLPVIMQFVTGPAKHRAEIAADRFAVEATGDVDLVARTLTKLHDINHQPHRLTPHDERMSTHPALVTRLRKLYDAVGQVQPSGDLSRQS